MRSHLAQVNVARMRAGVAEPIMADFAAPIDEMNRLAERSRGFLWRLRGSEIAPHELLVFENYSVPFDPARFFYNMSVWESADDLKRYVFNSTQVEMLRGKSRWMDHFDRASLALWWIPAGHRPTVAESAERLRAVEEKGATPFAFTFKDSFPIPDAERQA
jgi:Domain of unknown function (DUF3291)